MAEKRDPRFVDEKLRQQFIDCLDSLQGLRQQLEQFDWEIDEDDLSWFDTDYSNLGSILEKMEYTYHVE